jgi:peptidoglycan/xylan/chitin deacetylase (PgdA/CDA1 family)
MIYLRNDDILIHSNEWKSSTERFKKNHRWILECPEEILHVPAILVKDIQAFPECIEYIKEETAEGRMSPELHGWTHIDYKKLDKDETRKHLSDCVEWFDKTLNHKPKIFATPWGAKSNAIEEVAAEFDMIVQGAQEPDVVELNPAMKMVRNVPDWRPDNNTVMNHWWHRGNRLLRFILTIKYGSWTEAERMRPDAFME